MGCFLLCFAQANEGKQPTPSRKKNARRAYARLLRKVCPRRAGKEGRRLHVTRRSWGRAVGTGHGAPRRGGTRRASTKGGAAESEQERSEGRVDAARRFGYVRRHGPPPSAAAGVSPPPRMRGGYGEGVIVRSAS